MIILKKIDSTNFWQTIDLSVTREQEDFVVSNAVSIAQAYVQPECIPLAIYNDNTIVGFAMYCIDCEDDEYWIYRLMIDKNFQRKGYGRGALENIIELIKKDISRNIILLGVHLDAEEAVQLYKDMGFCFTGQVFGKEHIMELRY